MVIIHDIKISRSTIVSVVLKQEAVVKTDRLGMDTTSRIPLPANEVGNYRARWTKERGSRKVQRTRHKASRTGKYVVTKRIFSISASSFVIFVVVVHKPES